ncbi:ester cyclase [Acidobacteriota bacterium]
MKKTTIRIITVVPVLVLFFVLFYQKRSLRYELTEFEAQAEVEAQNKALVWKWYEAKLNQEIEMIHNEMIAPDFVGHSSDHPDAIPIETMFDMFPIEGREELVTARPLEPLIAEGDRVVFRYVVEVEDKGKEIKVEGFNMIRFEDGRIAEGWLLEDYLGQIQQLEAVYGTSETKK